MISILFLLLIINEDAAVSKSQLKWLKFNKGVKLIRKNKKSGLIYFWSKYCHWCRVMDKESFSDNRVVYKIKKYFVPIKVDIDLNELIIYDNKRYTTREFLNLFDITGTPAIIFMDKKGKFITKLSGFIKTELFLPILDYIEGKCYETRLTFEDYINNNKNCI